MMDSVYIYRKTIKTSIYLILLDYVFLFQNRNRSRFPMRKINKKKKDKHNFSMYHINFDVL